MTLRPLTPTDGDLLRTATLGNMNWRGPQFTVADIHSRPEFAHYTRLNPQRGDFGLAAERDGRPVGVAWALLLPDDDAGYGHVDAQTPEVSLWVAEPCRGQGIGRRLLQGLISQARTQGIARLSLSVEPDNVAKHLYSQVGFIAWPGGEADGIMVLDLTPGS